VIRDVDLLGIFTPALLLLMLAAWVVNLALKRTLEFVGFYRLVWHRHLFDFSMYLTVLGILVLLTVSQK
jgi:hypothetical protein